MIEILENNNNVLENRLIFQEDGAPPHYDVRVLQFPER